MKFTALLTATTLVLTSTAAFSAGSESEKPPKPTETTIDCEDGQVWDKKSKECVNPEDLKKASLLTDDAVYDYAREFAYAGQYDNALDLLNLASNQNDPRILNYKGFTHRKAGRIAKGMEFYQQALTIDPKYNLARSYYGQALIQDNQTSAAVEQLAMIGKNNGKGTWAYDSLSRALNGEATDY